MLHLVLDLFHQFEIYRLDQAGQIGCLMTDAVPLILICCLCVEQLTWKASIPKFRENTSLILCGARPMEPRTKLYNHTIKVTIEMTTFGPALVI